MGVMGHHRIDHYAPLIIGILVAAAVVWGAAWVVAAVNDFAATLPGRTTP